MGAAEDLDLTPAEREFLARLLIKLTGGRPMDERGTGAGIAPRKRPAPKKYPTGTPEQEMRIRADVMKRLQGKE